jgi:transposase
MGANAARNRRGQGIRERQIRQQIKDEAAFPVPSSKSNARKPIPHDTSLYAMRNLVERFFCKTKEMRRLATRFEKRGANFLNMIYLLTIRFWANESTP